MHTWHQDLTDKYNDGKFRFTKNFRGSVGPTWESEWFKYEFVLKPSARLSFSAYSNSTSLILGLGFFTLYLTLNFLVIPFVPKGRETGFYWYENVMWWFIGRNADVMGGDRETGYSGTIDPTEILLGKSIYFSNKKLKNYQPIKFMFRGKEYTMDEIKIKEAFWFRSRIPFGLLHKSRYFMDLNIKNPPMHQGKGTTSYNIGDDGTYGLHAPYKGPKIKYDNSAAVFKYCCDYYCKNASKSIIRYGRVNNDRDLDASEVGFEYIGWKSNNAGSGIVPVVQ